MELKIWSWLIVARKRLLEPFAGLENKGLQLEQMLMVA
jgi:hypothetical protein